MTTMTMMTIADALRRLALLATGGIAIETAMMMTEMTITAAPTDDVETTGMTETRTAIGAETRIEPEILLATETATVTATSTERTADAIDPAAATATKTAITTTDAAAGVTSTTEMAGGAIVTAIADATAVCQRR